MNKPVAWQVAEMLFDIEESAIEMAKVYGDKIIPLYTHPDDKLDKALKQNERLLNAMLDQRKFWEAEIEKKNTLLKMWEASHPVKELTDEEIEEIANENLGDSFDCDIMWMRMFVKAILRKAQEK